MSDESRRWRRKARTAADKVKWHGRRLLHGQLPRRGPVRSGPPAGFGAWLSRGPSSRWSGFPTAWSADADLRISEPAQVGVVMHVFYPELVDELIDRLGNLPVPFDLVVTNASGVEVAIDRSRLPQLRSLRVLEIVNHGRDIFPLAAVVNADLIAHHQLVLKVHTKRSPWRAQSEFTGDGAQWRTELLDSLLPEPDRLRRLLATMAEDRSIGVVTAPGSVVGAWGGNEALAAAILRRVELPAPDELAFPAGSMYWARGFVLQGLRSLNLTAADFEPEAGQVNVTAAHAVERIIGVLTHEAGLAVTDTDALAAPQDSDAWRALEQAGPRSEPLARVVPFFLPQFHSVAENDQWWGPGFTEWTNVAAAKPVYPGQWQPKLPRELGFYDLADPATLARHERLAADYGVGGFMFYHYWFSGRRILEAPLDHRRERTAGLPFCIMWANENWTRRWDGRSEDVLLAQDYAEVPADDFVASVLPELKHPDYLRVGGRPVLAVYRPAQIPEVAAVVAGWRERARAEGLGELCLLAVDVPGVFDGLSGSPRDNGFDGMMGFAPHNLTWTRADPRRVHPAPRFRGNIFDYAALAGDSEKRIASGVPAGSYPGVMTGFDNTARRPLASDLWFGANPYTFRRWLAAAVAAVADRPADERIVFVNAWNEWAEGAVLEPSDKFGLTYLQAVRDVVG